MFAWLTNWFYEGVPSTTHIPNSAIRQFQKSIRNRPNVGSETASTVLSEHREEINSVMRLNVLQGERNALKLVELAQRSFQG